MKITILIALFLGPLFSSSSFAQVLMPQMGSKKIEGVTLPSSANTHDGQKLQFVGAGLRNKKVFMVNVRVYVGSLLVADVTKFKKSAPLLTLSEAAPAAVQLHFLRDVDADKVQSSFKEALEANKVDLQKPEVQKFLQAVKSGGEIKKGTLLTILGLKNSDGSEVIVYEDSNLKATTISGGVGFLQNIFSIWLGHPSDEGVAQLKSDILK